MLNASNLRKPEIRQVVMDTFENCLKTTKVDPSLVTLMYGFSYDPDTKMIWFDLSDYIYLNSRTLEYLDSQYPYLDVKSHTEKLYSIQDDVLREIADKFTKTLGTTIYYDQNRFGLIQVHQHYTSDELASKSLTDILDILWAGSIDYISNKFLNSLEKALTLKPGTSFSEWYGQGGWEEVAKRFFNNRLHEVYCEFSPLDSIQPDFLKIFYRNEVKIREEIKTEITKYLDSRPRDFEQPRKVTKVDPPRFIPVLQEEWIDDSRITIWSVFDGDGSGPVYSLSDHLYLRPETINQLQQQYSNIDISAHLDNLYDIQANIISKIPIDDGEYFGSGAFAFDSATMIEMSIDAAAKDADIDMDNGEALLEFAYTSFVFPESICEYVQEIDVYIESIIDKTKQKVIEYLNKISKEK